MGTNFWKSDKVQFLLNKLAFKDGAEIVYPSANPTTVAYDAPVDSLALFGKSAYIKQDAGSTTNWTDITPTFENTKFDSSNEINGPVPHIDNLQKIYSHFSSSGVCDEGDLTDNADGTVSIDACAVSLRATADSHANLLHVNLVASGVLALTDNAANYLYIDYNAGTPQWAVSTSETVTNGLDKVLGYIVARRGTILKIIDARNAAVDFPNRAGTLFKDFGTFLHKEGGSILGATGLNVTVTAGRFWYGVNPIPHDAFDTSIAGTAPANVFTSIYGAYTITDDVKLLDNVNYDNAGTLTALGTGKWKVDWLYMVSDSPSTLALIYGTAQYNNKASAELAEAPSGLPPALAGVGTLIGRYLIQEGVAGAEAQSVFTTTFSAATVTNHNDLASLQGGTTDEYYHLTATEEGFLSGQDQAVKTTDDVVFNELDVTKSTLTEYSTNSLPLIADARDGMRVRVQESIFMYSATHGYWIAVDRLGKDSVSLIDFDGVEDVDALAINKGNSALPLGGGTLQGTLADATTTIEGKIKSGGYTQAVGSLNDRFEFPFVNLFNRGKGDLKGHNITYAYSGDSGDINAYVRDSVSGDILATSPIKHNSIATTGDELLRMVAKPVVEAVIGFHVVKENIGAELVFDDLEVITNPLPTAESVEVNSVKLEGNGGEAITANTENVVFNGAGTGWDDTAYEYTVQSNDSQLSLIVKVEDTLATSRETHLYKNGSLYKVLHSTRSTYYARTTGGAYIGSAGEFNAGDVLSIRVSTTLTLSNDSTEHYFNIVESASSNNVVFEGATSEEDIELRGVGNAGQAITAYVTRIPFIETIDSSDSWDGSTFTVPEDGIYTGTGRTYFSATSAGAVILYRGSDGTTADEYIGYDTVTKQSHEFSFTRKFLKGEQVNIRFTDTKTLSNNASNHNISITKQAINPLYSVPVTNERLNSISLAGNDGRAITALTENIPFDGVGAGWTSGADGSADNSYTVQKNGSTIDVSVGVASTVAVGARLIIYINGLIYKNISQALATTLHNGTYRIPIGDTVEGDLISIRSSAGITLNNDITTHHLSIIENYDPKGFFLGNMAYGVGVAQTWQSLLASRAKSTDYVNDTNSPIQVIIGASVVINGNTLNLVVDGLVVDLAMSNSGNQIHHSVSAIIPVGSTYSVSIGHASSSLTRWHELRE